MLSRPQNCSESVRATAEPHRRGLPARPAEVSIRSRFWPFRRVRAPQQSTAAARAGVENFGENFLQESLPKIAALAGRELTWHFIGRLQANKTRPVAENFAWVHGVDRLKIAERLSAQRPFTCAAAQRLPAAARGWRGQQGRRRSRRNRARWRAAVRDAAAPPAARSHVHAARRRPMSTRQRQWFRETRQVFDYLNEHGLGLDTLVDGHQRRLRSGHRRRRHHRAHRHRHIRPARYHRRRKTTTIITNT